MNTAIHYVTVELSGKTILQDINCQFSANQITAVVGANGAGKTTLLRALAALYQCSSGRITLDGLPLSLHDIELRRRLHRLADEPVFVGPTPLDHICQAAQYYQRDPAILKPQILSWLRAFKLSDVALQPMELLSRGQKYKTSFVGLLAMRPELWLLDEPFANGVDPQGMAAMRQEITKFVGGGGTVVYTTQIVEIAEQFSDRVLILADGQLKVDLPTDQLRQTHQDRALERILLELQVTSC